ncbi:NADP-dependent 3-hydroxy acid dehydrogenase YdfG/Flp pilus assembly protein TadD [Lewinella aquimaris]|uniref:NADP-dependent 3-hydroxy acid dehydrogenase YdfG/Flp pilus assembly protein TadD n=1 Tax=Neolewinella aquimaris TaxID=1835722 RepID=A0A840E320_9BACT|nr:SDR family NAD(P)-dependent oxidoreductase [Neolewinella aquimaris]MBB4078065.1 NADP-dependent 3-hydroxy acid dehydrogenase YdfG/Flp pilus assembly protein TadD [Neolewinella aquimaris]
MIGLAFAYTQDDAPTAARLEAALAGEASCTHLSVGRGNDEAVLSDLLGPITSDIVLLVSDRFLTNPNCMLRAESLFQPNRSLLPILIEQAEYADTDGTLVRGETKLSSRSDQMHYISHWHDRYIELRRDTDTYAEADRASFERYLRKIRETSVTVSSVVEKLGRSGMKSYRALEENHFRTLIDYVRRNNQTPMTPTTPPVGTTSRDPIQQSWRLADDGDHEAALSLLDSSRSQDPDNADLHYQYALMLALSSGKLQEARTELDALLEREPHHAEALFLSGELYESAGDYSAARTRWEQLSDLSPTFPRLNERLGTLLDEQFPEHSAEAAAYLRRAVKYEEAGADTLYRYAELLANKLGRRRKAVKMLRRAIRIDPGHAPAHYRLAVALFDAGKKTEARKNFAVATSLEPAYDTPVNQQAFYGAVTQEKPVQDASPLAALKENIAQLEAMLVARESSAPAPPPKSGAGKTVLISGATSGIGLATARRLAADGYRIAMIGRREDRLRTIGRKLAEEHQAEIHTITLDVRDRDGVGEAIASLPQEWQDIDILINNAGKAKGFDPIHAGSLDHWDEMIDVNLRGLLYLTRAVTPGMVKRSRGLVINVASTAGKEVYPNGNVYCATKHAVDALTYAMRLDLVKHGVKVGQICPAHVEETEFALVRFDGDAERAKIYQDFQPLRSSDVAEAIHFMVSQPAHVNILDLVLQGIQQASSTVVDRSGRDKYAPKEEE